MLQVNKQFFTVLVFIACIAIGSWHWFTGINAEILNVDEPLWITMTEFYRFRKVGDLEKFNLDAPSSRMGWGNFQNIVADQPQTGKYIMGFVLDIAGQDPWKAKDQSWIYTAFSTATIPGNTPPQMQREYLGNEMVSALETVRLFETTIGLLSLLLVASIAFLYHKNLIASGIMFLLMTWNGVFSNYLRKAMQDSTSLFFILIAGILVVKILQNIPSKTTSRSGLISLSLVAVAGMLAAIAASVKINGFFLLGLPLILSLTKVIKNKKNLNTFKWWILFANCLFLVSFFLMFVFLEPSTWNNPVVGISAFFHSRFAQQERFYHAFGHVSYLLVPAYLLGIFYTSIPTLLLKLLSFSLLAFGIASTWHSFRAKKESSKYIFVVSLFILVTNSYYAQTGFDRYLIPSLCLLYFFISIGIHEIMNKITS